MMDDPCVNICWLRDKGDELESKKPQVRTRQAAVNDSRALTG